MSQNVYCIMKLGPALTDKHRTVLFALALKLYHSSSARKRFKTPSFEGMISTERRWTTVGQMLGMKFSAELCGVDGTDVKVEYVVRPCDLSKLDGDHALVWEIPDGEPIESFADPAMN